MPPAWFIRSMWALHRAVYSVTRGRLGAWGAKADRPGMLRLRTVGRRTRRERRAMLGCYEDGSNLVLVAMNGWLDPDPEWWLNLQAHPDARVDLAGGSREVRARLASPDERSRLWAWLGKVGMFGDLDPYATRRSRETAIVILEPAG
jgi:deazaflavin-dependent oxidoreductase (nitroreductase family)